MYAADGNEELLELTEAPPPAPGAPLPIVVADDDALLVAYRIRPSGPDPGGGDPRPVSRESTDAKVAIVAFDGPIAHMFGPPNDEALNGHPLYDHGLRWYAVFEVKPSPWIRRLEDMSAVHPQHSPGHYADCRHFIVTFQDSTFECVARGLTASTQYCSMNEVAQQLIERLGPEG